uniref:Leucyl-cystinyl aminopeptidase n=2 Tax=Astyanax mexicanus TaxID=7994 RepID=A0A8B9HSR5_ASTMX
KINNDSNYERAPLPRNMIENSMFEEEPDVVDLAKESPSYPIDSDDVAYEPRSSRLLVRGLGENDMDEDEEDYESSARLLGMSFMNRSSNQRSAASSYTRQQPSGSCSMPSAKKTVVGILVLIVVASIAMVIYFLPRCTFSKDGCHKANSSMEHLYPVASNGELFPWRDIRLPTSVRPVQYELSLFPNLTTMTFQGNVTITLVVLQESKKIVLHSSDMKILKANFQGKEVPILEYKPWQQIAIKFSEEIKKGQEYVLNIVYTANLSNSYDGFYNSSYSDTAGVRRVLAATQFEPLAARKAFPCFDEPAFKASFLIKIKREAEYISLSNMPKAKTTPLPGGLFEDEFEKSVNMSTYLVAFIVANFVSANANVSNTLVSVYAVPDKKDQVHYALEAATKLLHFYNTFFEIEYPLRKLDLVGIPDFLAGAMENWGLITFRETTLLVGNHSSPIDKQLVTSVIAHELAHQWFGNLVTMRWWNDLWLNEGFATYMQYMSIEKVFPELDIDNEFLSVRFRAMAKDSLNSSHPVSSKVTTPEEVEEMFDSVSYEKGASILLMLNATLSEEAFRKGVIEYLTNYRGGNTENEDLWSSLSQVSKQSINVSQMMNTWTVQKGFPLVTVNRAGKQVKLTQEHFLLNAENATDRSHLWHIPLTYVNDTCSTSSGCKQVFLFKNKTATLEVPDSVKWLKFNYKSDGFYIVDYGMEGWMKLTEALKTNVNVLPHEDRASLINNLFSLSRKVHFQHYVLNLFEYLKNETETAPLTEALAQLNHIFRLLDKRSELLLVSRMTKYILDHFRDLMDSQSWEEESSVSKQVLRSALLETACRLNRTNCTTQAKSVYDEWIASKKTKHIPGDLLRVVLSVAAQTEVGWKELFDTYKHSIYDSEKRKTLEALASTQDVRKIVWILNAGLEGSEIQTPELPLVISTVCKHYAGYLYAWDFVKENWDKLTQKFPIGSFPLQAIIMATTSQFSTKAHLDEVERFFGSLKDRGSQMRSIQEAIETIKLNMRWMDRNLATLQTWL